MRRDFNKFTPRLSVSFKPTPEHHLYASYSKGFKGGGFDARGVGANAPDLNGNGTRDPDEVAAFLGFRPESVSSYELGYKGALFDRRLDLAATVFQADYRDVQIPGSSACTVGGLPSFCGVVTNAGRARFRGVELEVSGRLRSQDPEHPGTHCQRHADLYRADRSRFAQLQHDAVLPEQDPSVRSTNADLRLRPAGLCAVGCQPRLHRRRRGWSIGLHGKNLADKRYVTSGHNFLTVDPVTGVPVRDGAGKFRAAAWQGRYADGLLRQSEAGLHHPRRQVPVAATLAGVFGSEDMSTTFVDRWWRAADGLTLYARDYPAAAGAAKLPVLCIHGLTRNSKDFEDVAPWIAAQGRRVLAVDVRGRGRSDRDPRPGNYQPRVYARDMLALLDALGIARVVIVGTSMGGIIAMALAALRPGAIAAVVLNDVGPEIAPEGLARIASYAGKPVSIGDWEAATAYVRDINGPAFPKLDAAAWPRMARRMFRETGDGLELDYDPAITTYLAKVGGKTASLIAWRLFLRIARKRPALLVRGALSDIVSAETARKMKRRAPALDIAEVPDVGHAPLLIEPAARTAIGDFLGRIE